MSDLGEALASTDDPKLRKVGAFLRAIDRFAHLPNANPDGAALLMKCLGDAVRDLPPEFAETFDLFWLLNDSVPRVLTGDPKSIDALAAKIREAQQDRADALDDVDDDLAGVVGDEPASFVRRYVGLVTDASSSMEAALGLLQATIRFALEVGIQQTANKVARAAEREARGEQEAQESKLVKILKAVVERGKVEDRNDLWRRLGDVGAACVSLGIERIWIAGDRLYARWHDGRAHDWSRDHVGDVAVAKHIAPAQRTRR